jgi:hypothetical protein
MSNRVLQQIVLSIPNKFQSHRIINYSFPSLEADCNCWLPNITKSVECRICVMSGLTVGFTRRAGTGNYPRYKTP